MWVDNKKRCCNEAQPVLGGDLESFIEKLGSCWVQPSFPITQRCAGVWRKQRKMASIWENKKQKGNGIFSPPEKPAGIIGVIGGAGFGAKLLQYSNKKLLKLLELFCLEKISPFFCFLPKKVFCSTGEIVQPTSDRQHRYLLTLSCLCCGWALFKTDLGGGQGFSRLPHFKGT